MFLWKLYRLQAPRQSIKYFEELEDTYYSVERPTCTGSKALSRREQLEHRDLGLASLLARSLQKTGRQAGAHF